MEILNFEFKARAGNITLLEEKLGTLSPRYIGTDQQTDTYFNTTAGRLKLREGNIENALIHYDRADEADAKQSHIILYKHQPDEALKTILSKTLGVKVVVRKKRKIYFVDHVKFHFDEVDGLGTFVEVEAIDETGKIGAEKLQEQCRYYADFFGIAPADYISVSYSDMLIDGLAHP